jgi:hypothetical protein
VEFHGVGVERETFCQEGECFVVSTFIVELVGMIIEFVGTSEAFRHAVALLDGTTARYEVFSRVQGSVRPEVSRNRPDS